MTSRSAVECSATELYPPMVLNVCMTDTVAYLAGCNIDSDMLAMNTYWSLRLDTRVSATVSS